MLLRLAFIKISKKVLSVFEDNPYKVQYNEEKQFLRESIRENGVLSPLPARKIGAAEEYEVISGHRGCTQHTSRVWPELPTVTQYSRKQAVTT